MLNRISISTHSQIPLIHVVNEDDGLLSNNCNAQWYSILKYFPWKNYRELGASYYNALSGVSGLNAKNSYKPLLFNELCSYRL